MMLLGGWVAELGREAVTRQYWGLPGEQETAESMYSWVRRHWIRDTLKGSVGFTTLSHIMDWKRRAGCWTAAVVLAYVPRAPDSPGTNLFMARKKVRGREELSVGTAGPKIQAEPFSSTPPSTMGGPWLML